MLPTIIVSLLVIWCNFEAWNFSFSFHISSSPLVFVLFPHCFLVIWKIFCHFHRIWNCCDTTEIQVHGNTGMDRNGPEWTPEQTWMDRNGPEWTSERTRMDRNVCGNGPELTLERTGMDTGMDRNGHGNWPEWTPARTGMDLKIRWEVLHYILYLIFK